ncbi:hypothetical protein [Sinorhizobium saheli]|uniref:Uncharacterized protein n=1 Tax=Sinorhizobium saheli TaxID=36856 RepID=A0A178XVD9_SINSA|nr:hypothetical protein [Sinorhizobium saheli]MQW88560.1 hypothetical protein [Sinorhizobium saheli]OAP39269.1 hypothetical protein ATB98_02960 [Sinorhizobium saheli]
MSLEELLKLIETLARESLEQNKQSPTIENEMHRLLGDVYEALDDAGGQGISDYIEEKFNGLKGFALMAIGVHDRGGYGPEKILENIQHFAYLVRTRT